MAMTSGTGFPFRVKGSSFSLAIRPGGRRREYRNNKNQYRNIIIYIEVYMVKQISVIDEANEDDKLDTE